jgi:hypothetical protein
MWRGKSYDVALNESCKDEFDAAFREFASDGGPVEGVVNWIGDASEAQTVREKTHTHFQQFPRFSPPRTV